MVNNRTNKTVLYIFLFSIFNKTEILTLSSEKAFLFESRYIYKGSLLSCQVVRLHPSSMPLS